MARLREKYYSEIISALTKQLKIKNKLALPKIEKIVVNMGVGKALENKRRLECATRDLGLITGQKPIITKAKKSIAGFKLRQGYEVGCKVTLRGQIMYEFLDRLISVIVPRFRDFQGLSKTAFDKHGNYSMGLADQTVFPEINLDKVEFQQGMNITIVIDNANKKTSLALLSHFGMPFKRDDEGK